MDDDTMEMLGVQGGDHRTQETGLPEDAHLTDLPDVCLVGIMEFLSLQDRYYLSQTCHLFHELFSHSSLWKVAHISLYPIGASGKNRMQWKLTSMMNQTMIEIVKRYSHLFQHLSLQMPGFVQKFDETSVQLLKDLNEECRLESLTLALGDITSKDVNIQRMASVYSNVKDIPLIVGLIRNAMRLKQLNLISWPLHKEFTDTADIFKAMSDNQKLQYLESFNFFFLSKRDGAWTERMPQLPSCETTVKVVSHLWNLQHLSLRSPMLSDDLLVNLGSKHRNKLKTLQILVMFSKDSFYQEGIKIPELSSSSWAALRVASPLLKVECFITTRVPEAEVNSMLNTEMPLSSLIILNYGRCDSGVIHSLADKFKSTLSKFISLCDSSNCDDSLTYLVEQCSQLRHLSYHGDISHLTIANLSKIIKDKNMDMVCFEFKEKNVKTDDYDELTNDDDNDLAVAQDKDTQELYVVGMRRWHEDSTERERKLDSVSIKVSENLKCSWRPL